MKDRAAELGNATLVPLFSDEGNFARVDMMKQKAPDPLETVDCFMCGAKPTVDTPMADLKTDAIPSSNFHTETCPFRG